MSVELLSRSDDFGSAWAANEAILEGCKKGYVIRNVSCMAVAPWIKEGAEELKHCREIDVGIHLTLNSEWDGVKWGPLSEAGKTAGVTDEAGYFFSSQKQFVNRGIDLDKVMKEFDMQLDILFRLGLHVIYADTHMAPELFIPGLFTCLSEWTEKKGLINAGKYYSLPEQMIPEYTDYDEKYLDSVDKWLNLLCENNQYFYITHPAKKSEELQLFYNEDNPKGKIPKERNQEYPSVSSPLWLTWEKKYNIKFLRYSEAKEQLHSEETLRRIIVG